MEYEESLCFLDAEFETIWSKEFLYKKENYENIKPLFMDDEDLEVPF
jgi:hypothetical protein